MTPPPISVIIVSRGRPAALRRCLTGLEQIFYENFEVVIVADPEGARAVGDMGLADAVKLEVFDQPNISAARNIGARTAAGEIFAFIDDDAVPEPTWLDYLIAPFADDTVHIAGGYVLGRDGIRFQYRANWVDRQGWAHPLELDGDTTQVFAADADRATKTEGTNFAIRAAALGALGGFDEAFAYFLDETDLNMRANDAGMACAIVPDAIVHHGFLASDLRTETALPKTLFDIGASAAVFLRKHSPSSGFSDEIDRFRRHQGNLLDRHLRRGNCTDKDVTRIIATFDDGVIAGQSRYFGDDADIAKTDYPFNPFIPRHPFTGSTCLSGRPWQGRRLRKKAAKLVASGQRTTLFLFSPTLRRHRMTFHDAGFWEQTGGLFRSTKPAHAIISLNSFAKRVTIEKNRLSAARKFE